MKLLFLLALLFALPAQATEPPANTGALTMPVELLQSVVGYLKNGGTRNEADALAQRIIDLATAPQREAQQRAKWEAEAAEKRKSDRDATK